jgi:hypothetical protein
VPEPLPPSPGPYPPHGGTYVESADGSGWECVQEPARPHCAGEEAGDLELVEQTTTED